VGEKKGETCIKWKGIKEGNKGKAVAAIITGQ